MLIKLQLIVLNNSVVQNLSGTSHHLCPDRRTPTLVQRVIYLLKNRTYSLRLSVTYFINRFFAQPTAVSRISFGFDFEYRPRRILEPEFFSIRPTRRCRHNAFHL